MDIDKKICQLNGILLNNSLGDPYYLYYQLYEVINDLLFTLFYMDAPYLLSDFDTILSQTYIDRIPVLEKMRKNDIVIKSFPMRSGMDAFANATMAINHVPQDVSIAPKVNGFSNRIYFEIDDVINLFDRRTNRTKTSYISLREKLSSENKEKIKDAFIRAFIRDSVKIKTNKDLYQENEEKFKIYWINFQQNHFHGLT